MGREIFAQLRKAVHRENIQIGNNYLYLCDMSGTGKSHLLVCQLVFEGKRRRLVDDILLIQGALVSAPCNMSECPLFSASLLLLRRFMAWGYLAVFGLFQSKLDPITPSLYTWITS